MVKPHSIVPPRSKPLVHSPAVLYEEGQFDGDEGHVFPGSVQWEFTSKSFGGQKPEPIVRASADILERQLRARFVIRKNRDGTLPASHLIDVSFQVSSDFTGKGIANVPGLIMKEEETARGNALLGTSARVSNEQFWVALSANPEDEQTNRRLLSDRRWIDIPILYENGRRAILTLQKGSQGEQAIHQAFDAWSHEPVTQDANSVK